MRSIDWTIIPSIWWENSPIVIQESFFHGRPMICSNIGGMAEKITDGVDGLHFRVGSSEDLVDRMIGGAHESGALGSTPRPASQAPISYRGMRPAAPRLSTSDLAAEKAKRNTAPPP